MSIRGLLGHMGKEVLISVDGVEGLHPVQWEWWKSMVFGSRAKNWCKRCCFRWAGSRDGKAWCFCPIRTFGSS